MMPHDTIRGSLEMTAAMLIAGTIGWFVLMSGQPVVDVVFWRCLIGALVMAPVCMMLGQLRPTVLAPRVLLLAALGGGAIVVNWLLLFASYSYASISVATVLYNTQPFMLVGFGVLFLGERVTLPKLLWLGAAFAGMVLIVQAKPDVSYAGGDFLYGVFLALAAAFFYAVAAIVAKKLKGTPPHLITLVQTIVGTVMLAPFVGFAGLPQEGGAWASLVAIGAVHTGLMYVLLYSAFQRLPTPVAASLSFVYPVAAILVDLIVFGVRLHPVQIAGSTLILVAVAGMQLGWRPRKGRAGVETA